MNQQCITYTVLGSQAPYLVASHKEKAGLLIFNEFPFKEYMSNIFLLIKNKDRNCS